MATLTTSSRDRYLHLGGPVETAPTRARLLASLATLIYAACVFGLVLLAHEVLDNAPSDGSGSSVAALHTGKHRF